MSLLESTTQSVQILLRSLGRRLRRNALKRSPRKRYARRLRGETLETRRLLAADFQPFHHNRFDAEDVNDDGLVTPMDALIVIDSMNQQRGSDALHFIDVSNDGFRSPLDALMVINRLNRGEQGMHGQQPTIEKTIPSAPDEVRSIDGTNNNLESPELGSTGEELLRIADAEYDDGISTPAGADRPSTREISNLLSDADPEGTTNDRGLSAFIYVWGQFIDHDIDLTLNQVEDPESLEIEVPTGDLQFDPTSTGEVTISLTRSQFAEGTGTSEENPREQVSEITAFVDGSQVYGSDLETANSLREFEGGRMLITDDGLLPTDADGQIMAGDIRASENVALTSLQTLFVREHNRLADAISAGDTSLTDEEIYQQARAIVIAEIQAITYNEFLPALLGKDALSSYDGYDASVNPTIANEFSTAAFRFGHSTLNDDVEFFDNDGRPVGEEIPLTEAFLNPQLLEETGIDSILKYDASTLAQEIDLEVVDSLRNALFGPPGSGGLDLVALNIQRGRDHGLADYNATREAYGLEAFDSFDDITSDVELQQNLESLYGDVNNIDLWVGLLAEDHVRNASVGELAQTIIADQFERLRDGDRFWYETSFQGSALRQLQQTSLSDIIERNTEVEGLQDNVFFMIAEVSGTVNLQMDAPSSQKGAKHPQSSTGVAGVTLELLDDSGEVVDSTTSDSRGNYRFNSFAHTGDYQIRLVGSDEYQPLSSDLVDLLVSNGKTRLRGLDFTVASV
ncbi:peroxidase family protein [Aureliella helgolandensis]|nr:peroxidase family protein [Aureliella helgolandensis]